MTWTELARQAHHTTFTFRRRANGRFSTSHDDCQRGAHPTGSMAITSSKADRPCMAHEKTAIHRPSSDVPAFRRRSKVTTISAQAIGRRCPRCRSQTRIKIFPSSVPVVEQNCGQAPGIIIRSRSRRSPIRRCRRFPPKIRPATCGRRSSDYWLQDVPEQEAMAQVYLRRRLFLCAPCCRHWIEHPVA